jgi:TetR/AcrR family transcriptional regulator
MALKRRAEDAPEDAAEAVPVDSRRARELSARRQAILDAAELVFGKKGYHDASMAEIAKIAEFGVGYLYRLFEDKGDLFLAVLERKFDALTETTQATLSLEGSARARLHAATRVHLAFFESNRAFFKLFFEQGQNSPPDLQAAHKSRIIPKFLVLRAQIRSVMSEGIASGELKELNPENLTSAFFGILQGFMSHWLYNNQSSSLTAQADVAAAIFFDGAARK